MRNKSKNAACSSIDSLTLKTPTCRSWLFRTHLPSADWTTFVRSRLSSQSRAAGGRQYNSLGAAQRRAEESTHQSMQLVRTTEVCFRCGCPDDDTS